MAKVKLYYCQFGQVGIKTEDYNKLLSFFRSNKKEAKGILIGSVNVPAEKLQYCIDNVSIEELNEWKKEKSGREKNNLYKAK